MTETRITPPTRGGSPRKRGALPLGRQTKLTPDVQKKIIDAVRAGAFLSTAARYAGVGESTLMNWMARGRACTNRNGKDKIYREFLEEIDMAEASSEVAANLQWRAAWAKDWHAAEKWLGSRYPERYGANRDPNAPTQAFAGVNISIGLPNGQSGTSSPLNSPDTANVPLETLIEANPRLLGATMHLFDEIDAIYSANEAKVADARPVAPIEHQIAPYSPTEVDFEDFGVIEGTFTPVGDEND